MGSPVEQGCPQDYPAVAVPSQVLGHPSLQAPGRALTQSRTLPQGISPWPTPTPQAPTRPPCPCHVTRPGQEEFSSIIFPPVALRCPKPSWGPLVPAQSPPTPFSPTSPAILGASMAPVLIFPLLSWSCGWARMSDLARGCLAALQPKRTTTKDRKMTKLNTPAHKC